MQLLKVIDKKEIMRISVVIATYNGIEFIEEQLNSIKNQTRQADEVLIRDDGSTDGTCEFLKKYIEDNKLLSWTLNLNEENLGYRRNFIQLLKDSSGDVIFLSDQDDIWNPVKLHEMTNEMEKNKDIYLLSSDYTPFSNSNLSHSVPGYKGVRKGNTDWIDYRAKNAGVLRPGHGYAIRRELLPYAFRFFDYDKAVSHDAALQFTSGLLGKMYNYPYSMDDYRLWSGSSSSQESKKRQNSNLSPKEASALIFFNDMLKRYDSAISFCEDYRSEIRNYDYFYRNLPKSKERFVNVIKFIKGRNSFSRFKYLPRIGLSYSVYLVKNFVISKYRN